MSLSGLSRWFAYLGRQEWRRACRSKSAAQLFGPPNKCTEFPLHAPKSNSSYQNSVRRERTRSQPTEPKQKVSQAPQNYPIPQAWAPGFRKPSSYIVLSRIGYSMVLPLPAQSDHLRRHPILSYPRLDPLDKLPPAPRVSIYPIPPRIRDHRLREWPLDSHCRRPFPP